MAARKLLRRAARVESGRFLVEGVRPVRDALRWAEEAPTERRVHDLFVTEAVAAREPELAERAAALGVRTATVTEKAAAGLSETVTPQGVAVVCRQVVAAPADAVRDAVLVAVLVGVTDPGNAGTVIRTADAAGADAVVLAGDAVDPHNGKCVRASMGSLFHVPVAVAPDVPELLVTVRRCGIATVATGGRAEVELGPGTDDLLAGRIAWLFGSEAHGLDDAVSAAADHRVRIPVHGRAESLNLAAAAAVCLYASVRAKKVSSRHM